MSEFVTAALDLAKPDTSLFLLVQHDAEVDGRMTKHNIDDVVEVLRARGIYQGQKTGSKAVRTSDV